ncbi:hypothetical protein QWY31_16390 [Cytophagales bacterium LB-30]|uniref:Toxin-antitoxin system YwqK family antitoxin n=1 Tax=Shiella aurantiaca TaxID=3058365 RepID=A0ABT8FAT6_9BACT|nr:hypothetical protein [Shiella aurantiaca]MDN4167091.1 hypothetical protein [Shiella aurantiaca]
MPTFLKSLFCLLLVVSMIACASSTQQLIDSANNSPIILKTDSGTASFRIMPINAKPRVTPDSEYHWYHGGAVHVNKGGFSGRLLHGPCSFFDLEGRLMMQGEYEIGRKSGEWVSWHPNGEKKSVEKWKKGQLVGTLMVWDEQGELLRQQEYKAGLLHGESLEKKGMTWDTLYYKKGLLKEPDTKRLMPFGKRKEANQVQDSVHVSE